MKGKMKYKKIPRQKDIKKGNNQKNCSSKIQRSSFLDSRIKVGEDYSFDCSTAQKIYIRLLDGDKLQGDLLTARVVAHILTCDTCLYLFHNSDDSHDQKISGDF
jgi:hypothetical protein